MMTEDEETRLRERLAWFEGRDPLLMAAYWGARSERGTATPADDLFDAWAAANPEPDTVQGG